MPTKREKEAHTILTMNEGQVELVAADEVVGGKCIRIEHGHSDLGLLKLLYNAKCTVLKGFAQGGLHVSTMQCYARTCKANK